MKALADAEASCGFEPVAGACMLLWCARDSLTLSDLEGLVSEELKGHTVMDGTGTGWKESTWPRLRHCLEKSLVVPDANRLRLTIWARDAVEERYLFHGRVAWHQRLATWCTSTIIEHTVATVTLSVYDALQV